MRAEMSSEIPQFYEFATFRLDPAAKVLLHDTTPVPLTPKVFDTLQFFVEHPGQLLGKDELMQQIRQDRVVDESNLSYNIKMLRRALGDSAQQPRFIETVPRRGFRFIAEVKEVFRNKAKSFDYVIAGPSKSSLWRQPLGTYSPSLVMELGNDDIKDIAPSPDGSTVAFVRGKWMSDAVLIEGLK